MHADRPSSVKVQQPLSLPLSLSVIGDDIKKKIRQRETSISVSPYSSPPPPPPPPRVKTIDNSFRWGHLSRVCTVIGTAVLSFQVQLALPVFFRSLKATGLTLFLKGTIGRNCARRKCRRRNSSADSSLSALDGSTIISLSLSLALSHSFAR